MIMNFLMMPSALIGFMDLADGFSALFSLSQWNIHPDFSRYLVPPSIVDLNSCMTITKTPSMTKTEPTCLAPTIPPPQPSTMHTTVFYLRITAFFFCYLSVIGVHLESTTSHRYWAVSHLAFIPRDIIAEDQLWITACFIDWNSCYCLNRSLDSCQWSAAATLCFIGGSARLKLEAICANTLLLIETGGKHNGWTLTVNPTMNSMNPNYKASSPPVKVHSVLCF